MGHVGVALARAHQASLESEHPACARHRERCSAPCERLHGVHQVRQGHQGLSLGRRGFMQGVIKSYDPVTGDGSVISDTDLAEYSLAPNALDGSIFRMVRQGQRVVFSLDSNGRATTLRLGSEADMGTPGV